MKYFYTLVLIFIISQRLSAHTPSEAVPNKIYNNAVADLDISSCAQAINKADKIQKEFSDTKFRLDLIKGQLHLDRKNEENSKVIEFTLDDSKLIFKDQEEYGKMDAYLIFENHLPVLQFKDHPGDCFFYQIKFSE